MQTYYLYKHLNIHIYIDVVKHKSMPHLFTVQRGVTRFKSANIKNNNPL